MRGYGVAGLRECGNAGYKREKAARRGAQLRYVRQLFVMSHLQVLYLGCQDRELIDMMEKIFRFRCALLAKWSVIFMQTAAETIRFRPSVTEWRE